MEKQALEQLKEHELKLRNKMTEKNKKQDEKIAEASSSRDKKKIVNDKENVKQNKENEEIKDKKIFASESEQVKSEVKSKNEKKEEPKKPIVKKQIKKKDFAIVNGKSLPISTKHAVAICKFIKGKKINDAIEYLEQVVFGKKAIPMKGEIPHRKGKMMSGRFPKNASQQFIKLLRSLGANANANNLEEAIISEAIANKASRPYGRFGRTQKKRTHVLIKCREKKND